LLGVRLAVIREIAATTLREFFRTKEALFWSYGFPVVVSVALGLAFGETGSTPARVAVLESAAAPELLQVLADERWVRAEVRSREDAEAALRSGAVDLIVGGSVERPEVWRDETRDASELAYLTFARALEEHDGTARPGPAVRPAAAHSQRYIDFLIPGLIALNLLGAGLWGVGFNLVDMRIKHLLRRLVVAPMLKSEFLIGFLLSRLGLIVLDAFAIVGFGVLVFDVPVRGSWLLLTVLFAIGGLAFSGLGLVVAARPRTFEGVSGLVNLVMLPMWLLGGSFFATSHFPSYFEPLIDALPLTHVNDALRAVMLEGAGLAAVWPQLAFLSVFAAVCFAVALRLFRWT
jgi:ABC-type multidrug transport system permease subunit